MNEPLEMSINEASGCADVFAGIIDIGIIYDPEEARHIIACVNALAGIRPDLIEQGGFAAVPVATHREVKQQRDDLLAIVKRYRNEVPMGHQPHMITDVADAAIAAAEARP